MPEICVDVSERSLNIVTINSPSHTTLSLLYSCSSSLLFTSLPSFLEEPSHHTSYNRSLTFLRFKSSASSPRTYFSAVPSARPLSSQVRDTPSQCLISAVRFDRLAHRKPVVDQSRNDVFDEERTDPTVERSANECLLCSAREVHC
jgi:hypothetical protein